jgi:Glycosyl transferase family 2
MISGFERAELKWIAERGQAESRWRFLGRPELELVVEITGTVGTLVLAMPGRSSGQLDARKGEKLLSKAEVQDFLINASIEGMACQASLLLRSRTAQHAALGPIAVSHNSCRVTTAAAWIGWPDLGLCPARWPNTIEERLISRSNDYWPIELASHALGLGDLVHGVMSVPEDGNDISFSVVVPARGAQDLLPSLLESLLQSAKSLPRRVAWECVIVDDCSDTPLVLPSDVPDEISLLRLDTRGYSGGARTAGIRNAKYSTILFCDADIRVPANFFAEHMMRHALSPNLITVSMREGVPEGRPLPARAPRSDADSRHQAHYGVGKMCFVDVTEPQTIRPLADSREFRDLGYRNRVGPVDLPFMVKSMCFGMNTHMAKSVEFPPDFVGWGPEDCCFAAKCIARGAFVLPVLSTSVFHVDHAPRSGSKERQESELAANMERYRNHLDSLADQPWQACSANAK